VTRRGRRTTGPNRGSGGRPPRLTTGGAGLAVRLGRCNTEIEATWVARPQKSRRSREQLDAGRQGGSNVMRSTPHQRSIHIDAPVEKVFDHVKDPNSFVAADPEPVHLSNLSLTPEGVGSTWRTSWRAFGLRLHGVWTREECIPNKRIVDHVSTGVTWTYTTEPNPTGTTLSLAFAITTKVPLANKVLNWAFSSQKRQLDKMLASYQKALQA